MTSLLLILDGLIKGEEKQRLRTPLSRHFTWRPLLAVAIHIPATLLSAVAVAAAAAGDGGSAVPRRQRRRGPRRGGGGPPRRGQDGARVSDRARLELNPSLFVLPLLPTESRFVSSQVLTFALLSHLSSGAKLTTRVHKIDVIAANKILSHSNK